MEINFAEQNVPISMRIGSDYAQLPPELKPFLIAWVRRAIGDGLRHPGQTIVYEAQSWETEHTIAAEPLWAFLALWLFRTDPRHADVICYVGSAEYVRAHEAKIRGRMNRLVQLPEPGRLHLLRRVHLLAPTAVQWLARLIRA
jgi:hypothetical protein